MTSEHDRGDSPCPRGMSRRRFIKLAAMTSLLAGCRPIRQLVATPTSTPITGMRPDAPNKVVRARHSGVWDGDTLVPEATRQMLDGSIRALTGLGDANAAWAALFDPSERIAIKVNTIRTSDFYTHVPLVMAVTECLQDAGIPAEQIVIFDRFTWELEMAGYPVNEDGPGVRCHGTDDNYTAGWSIMDTDVRLSDILLSCDALINMPILKRHSTSGLTFAMKNHYGTFDRPGRFHAGIEHAMPELNALPPIKDRTRLIIGDALTVCTRSWNWAVTGDSTLMSFAPVTHDTVGLVVFAEALASEGYSPGGETALASRWLENGAQLGLGTNEPGGIQMVEVRLG
jgi:hypothetical protein